MRGDGTLSPRFVSPRSLAVEEPLQVGLGVDHRADAAGARGEEARHSRPVAGDVRREWTTTPIDTAPPK